MRAVAAGLACAGLLLAGPLWAAEDAQRAYRQARRAERRGDAAQALAGYLQARALKPWDRQFAAAVERLTPVVLAAVTSPQADDPEPPPAPLDEPPEEILRGRRLEQAPRLQPDDKRVDVRFEGSAEEAFRELADRFGVQPLFDEDFEGPDEIEIELRDVDFPRAVVVLSQLSGAFVFPVSERIFYVAEDTQQKRIELEPVVVAEADIPEAQTPQAAQELVQAIQQVIDIRRLHVSANTRKVYLRDTVRKVRLARALYERLSAPKAEVLIEVELLAADRTRQVTLGTTTPTSFPVSNLATALNNQPATPEGRLIGLGGGETAFGVGVGSVQLDALLARGESQTLQRFFLRASDGMQADLRIGERFPIINARFSAVVVDEEIQDQIDEGTLRQPFPSFTFEDLGLILTVTPTIHDSRQVTLALETEFKVLSGATVNEVPVLANRQLTSQVRLELGEIAFVSGMVVLERRRNGSGLAGLAEIPWIGRLFGRGRRDEFLARELVLAIRPQLVRLPEEDLRRSLTVRYGPEERPLPGL